jgi:hypothetical protein
MVSWGVQCAAVFIYRVLVGCVAMVLETLLVFLGAEFIAHGDGDLR